MSSVIFTKTYEAPPVSERDILRYAGAKVADDELYNLLHLCLDRKSVV